MVKNVFTYILIAILLVNLMAYQCVYVCFKIQQQRIAATLCVQKDIKTNTCQGKCHLKKMVKKAEAPTQKIQEELKKDFICHALRTFEVSAFRYLADDRLKTYDRPKLMKGSIRMDYSPPDFHFTV